MAFYRTLDLFADNPALITEHQTMTYAALVADGAKIAEAVSRDGLIFHICDNNVESVVGYLAFLRKGRAQALINAGLDAALLAALTAAYKPGYIWLCAAESALFPGYTPVYTYGGYVLLASAEAVCYAINPALALLLTTSGSTGSPKFVRQSFANISHNADAIASYLTIAAQDRPITTLPMSYTFGLSVLNSHLAKGCAVVLTNKKLMDKSFWAFFHDTAPTTFSGVPFTFQMLTALGFQDMDLPSVRTITQAGGKMPQALAVEWATVCAAKGIRFFTMYGQTEATARMAYLPYQRAIDKAGSIGIAIPGGALWLEDENGEVIDAPDTDGELVYRGENVTMGYSTGYSDLALGDENGGILHTGDMARRDGEGFYYITGRKKRFLKIFGNRINLEELQNLLLDTGVEAAVTGTDDNLHIFITRAEHRDIVKDFVVQKTHLSVAGFSVHVIAELPHTHSGKMDYAALLARVAETNDDV